MLVRLEMDEERMSWLSFAGLPPWAMLLTAHIALVDLHQAAEPVALIAVTHRLADLVQLRI